MNCRGSRRLTARISPELAKCRKQGEWFNKLLTALEEDEDHPGWKVEDVHTALGSVQNFDVEKLEPNDPRRLVNTPTDEQGTPVLDHGMSFIGVRYLHHQPNASYLGPG